MFAELPVRASSELRGIIDGIVKVEDTRLSSDDSKVAITDFRGDAVHVFALQWETDDEGRRVPTVESGLAIQGPSIAGPHGICFAGDDHILVANRHAGVDVYAIPAFESRHRIHRMDPLAHIKADGGLFTTVKTPGSIAARRRDDGRFDVIIGNNRWHFLSATVLDLGGGSARFTDRRVIANGAPLRHPEGLVFSPDGSLVAVSNDVSGTTLVYDADALLAGESGGPAVLRGPVCPHMSQWLPDGRMLATDASSPYLFVYEPSAGGWRGDLDPAFAVRILTHDQFFDGRLNSRDGGVKGLVVDSTGTVVISSRHPETFRPHDVAGLLAEPVDVDAELVASLMRERDAQVRSHAGHAAMLTKTWDLRSRAELTVRETIRRHRPTPRRHRNRRQKQLFLEGLETQNWESREPLVADGGPAVSLTTFGPRMETAYYAIECMARGSQLPGRVVLWLAERDAEDVPHSLRRLEARGLEIRTAPDTKAYKKYLPYVLEEGVDAPLVTADDDALYDSAWLEGLWQAHLADPDNAHAHRAKRMKFFEGRLLPYDEWGACTDTVPSHRNFVTGVSGAIYPPALLERLRDVGYEFQDVAPHNDDVWINVNALRSGVRVAQVTPESINYRSTPDSQDVGLMTINVIGGWNQIQLRRVYGPAELSVLLAETQRTAPVAASSS